MNRNTKQANVKPACAEASVGGSAGREADRQMVYKLYGLTDEEIKIVEGNSK